MKLRITVEGKSYEVEVQVVDETQTSASASPAPAAAPAAHAPPPPKPAAAPQRPAPPSAGAGDVHEVKCPIAGSVLSIKVAPGAQVNAGDTILVLEAMKMESNIATPVAGVVKEVCVKERDSVSQGQVLVRFE